MTDQTLQAKRRRLGRGLGSLMSTPVPIDRTGPDGLAVEVKRPIAEVGPAARPSEPAGPEAMPSTETRQRGSDMAPVDANRPGASETGVGSMAAEGDHIAYLPLASVVPNPNQPRQHFDAAALDALAASIRAAGVMQPIVVRPAADGRHVLIAGERRWRAAGLAGLPTIPAVVREVDDQVAAEWALIENLQREDLNPIEKAEAFRALAETFDLTHAQIAERVGLDRSSISNLLRLNDLDDYCRDAIRRGDLMMGHARALLGIDSPEARARLARLVVRHGWSVRETERQVALAGAAADAPPTAGEVIKPASASNRHIEDLEARLSRHLGTRVRIQPSRRKGRGKLIIDFYSLDEFDGLMQRIGFDGSE